jgi:hypothetical protein
MMLPGGTDWATPKGTNVAVALPMKAVGCAPGSNISSSKSHNSALHVPDGLIYANFRKQDDTGRGVW